MALGHLGDIVTFTPTAGQFGAGVVQTGIVIQVPDATHNLVAYNFSVPKVEVLDWAHEALATSVTVLGNQPSKHCGGC